jgi:hypothetical protein
MALAAFLLIETAIPRNTGIYSDPFFELRYLRDADMTDACVTSKLKIYSNQHISFLQVGDSSSRSACRKAQPM